MWELVDLSDPMVGIRSLHLLMSCLVWSDGWYQGFVSPYVMSGVIRWLVSRVCISLCNVWCDPMVGIKGLYLLMWCVVWSDGWYQGSVSPYVMSGVIRWLVSRVCISLCDVWWDPMVGIKGCLSWCHKLWYKSHTTVLPPPNYPHMIIILWRLTVPSCPVDGWWRFSRPHAYFAYHWLVTVIQARYWAFWQYTSITPRYPGARGSI